MVAEHDDEKDRDNQYSHEMNYEFSRHNTEAQQLLLGSRHQKQQTQVLSQQIIPGRFPIEDYPNEFELTRKLEQHAFSQGTQRDPPTHNLTTAD